MAQVMRGQVIGRSWATTTSKTDMWSMESEMAVVEKRFGLACGMSDEGSICDLTRVFDRVSERSYLPHRFSTLIRSYRCYHVRIVISDDIGYLQNSSFHIVV